MLTNVSEIIFIYP